MNTLIPDPFKAAVKTLSGSLEKFLEVKNALAYLKFEAGKCTEDEYLKNIFKENKEKEAGFTAQEFKTEMLKTPSLYPGVQECLNSLKSEYKLYLASNYGPWFSEHYKNSGLENLMDGYFVSYQLKIRKPNPAFFKKILQKLKINPENAIFIDDQPLNVAAASKLGIKSILAESGWIEELKKNLISLG